MVFFFIVFLKNGKVILFVLFLNQIIKFKVIFEMTLLERFKLYLSPNSIIYFAKRSFEITLVT